MLPEGEKVVEDLETEFLPSVDEFLEELKQKRVTGYISFEGNDGEGFAAVDAGVPGKVKVTRNGVEKVEHGADGLREVFDTGSYTVQVVDCSESGREIVDIKLNNDEIKTDMKAGDVDLPKFLKTNITEQKNDCHIVVFAERYSGIVTMVDGIPAQAKLSTEDEIHIGDEALQRILEGTREGGVVLDIYRISEDSTDQVAEEVIGEQMEDELESISSDFEDKADDLLDDMGLGIGDGGGGGDAGGGEEATAGGDGGTEMNDLEAEIEQELEDEMGDLGDDLEGL